MYVLFSKHEPGSAVVAAGAMHASAHVHAIRYGRRGTKPYRQAYNQHIGRFLSLVRSSGKVQKAGPDKEARDAMGRWTRALERKGIQLHQTAGILGKTREQVVAKIRNILDDAVQNEGGKRAAKYVGGLAGLALGSTPGMDTGTTRQAMILGAHAADQIREATGTIIGKAMEHPGFKNLAKRVLLRKGIIHKALEDEHCNSLKNIVAGVMADTRLDPHVSYSDGALAAVAHGAYRHLHDRVCALRDAAHS